MASTLGAGGEWCIGPHPKKGGKFVASYYNFKTRKVAGASSVPCAMNLSKHSATQLGWAEGDPPPEFPTNLDELRAAWLKEHHSKRESATTRPLEACTAAQAQAQSATPVAGGTGGGLVQAVALRRGLFARLSAGSSGGSLGGSPDGTSGRSSGGSSGGSTVTADLSPKSAIVLKALAKAVAQSEKRSEQRAAAQAQRSEQRAAERTEELKRCLAKEFAESKLHTTQTVKNDGDETRTAVVSTAKANMMAMFSASKEQQGQQQASCLSLLDHITTTASDAAADRTRHASEAATERTCVEERQKVQMGALGGEMQQAVKETRNMLVQSHNQVTTDVIAALNPITEEMRMAIAVLLGSTQDLQAPSQLGAVAGLLGQIQADTSLLRSAFVNECGEPGGAIFDVIKQMVDKLPTAAKEADEAKATLAQEEAKATALAEAKATADAKAAEEAEATAKAAAAKARSRRPAAVKASAAFSKPPSSTKSSSAKAAPPVPPPPPLAPVSGVQTVTGAAARLKDPSSDHSVMIASLGRLQPLLRRVPVEKRAALLSPTGIISVGLACAIAFRRTAVVQKSLEVLEALAGEFTTDLAGVVSAVMEVIILHCSRAKESSVWIPCKKAAPIIAVKAPSNELLLALMDCVVNKASEVNKYAGCREAAGLALSALLNSAVRGEIAKGIVMPNVDAIADAIVALLIDATKPKQGALASKPDIHEAGVACYEWLRMLDQPAAQKVYSEIEAVSPIILEGLQVP